MWKTYIIHVKIRHTFGDLGGKFSRCFVARATVGFGYYLAHWGIGRI